MKRTLGAMTVGFVVAYSLAQSSQETKEQPQDKRENPMVVAMKAIPGVLGVEETKGSDGKEIALVWFEDREAVLRWYRHPMHQEVMQKYFGDQELRKPLANLPEDTGPILAVVCFTRSDKPIEPFTIFSALSVELYSPLPGGFFHGKRLSPKTLEVEGLRDFTPLFDKE